jgi:hypothetical protein
MKNASAKRITKTGTNTFATERDEQSTIVLAKYKINKRRKTKTGGRNYNHGERCYQTLLGTTKMIFLF